LEIIISRQYSITTSSDGKFVYALTSNLIISSSDYGASWSVATIKGSNWQSIATTSTGTFVYAGDDVGGIYTSSNFGADWSLSFTTLKRTTSWQSIASSDDGNFVYAVVGSGGFIYSLHTAAAIANQPILN
jgi:photosystem II stability/assembly factor-like uncharacterized protein